LTHLKFANKHSQRVEKFATPRNLRNGKESAVKRDGNESVAGRVVLFVPSEEDSKKKH
jgi:hypothetical protein